MSLPGGRTIVVDDKTYEWICKGGDYNYGDDDVPVYDKTVTIRSIDNGKLIQHRVDRSAVTPEFVASMIRADVIRGNL